MKRTTLTKLMALGLAASASLTPLIASGDDIDIFTGTTSAALNPRILIVLDNTSNWSRQSQKWPDGSSQGQSEVQAISEVLQTMNANINMGLMEFVTVGNANMDGGFVRSHIVNMDTANKASLTAKLATIAGAINDPTEKRNSNTAYGNLMYDAYSYFAGGMSYSPDGVASTLADSRAYTTQFTRFASPIPSGEVCGKSFIIFIGNADSSGPTADSSANTAALNALTGEAGGTTPISQLGLPNYRSATFDNVQTVGHTASCYASQAEAEVERAGFNLLTACSSTSEGCVIGQATASTVPIACPSGSLSYTVIQAVYTPPSTSVSAGTPIVGTPSTTTGNSTGMYSSDALAQAAIDAGTERGNFAACPAQETVITGNNTAVTTSVCTYTLGAAQGTAFTDTAGYSTSQCYSGTGTGTGQWNNLAPQEIGNAPACPSGLTCSYPAYADAGSSGGCGTQRRVIFTQRVNNKRTYTITRTVVRTTVNSTATTTPASTAYNTLGKTAACYTSPPSTSTGDYAGSCTGTNISCTYNNAPTSTTVSACPAGTSVYAVTSNDRYINNEPTGTTVADIAPFNADEWARFMYEKGIPVSGSTIRPQVSTYTIDVHNAQPNAKQTSLLLSMATNSGGKYFAARSKEAIKDALKSIMIEIQAVNTTFASTSLPVNATNRSQNENQVFIGMFRPDAGAKPRWFGNLKRYKLILEGSTVTLGDVTGMSAVNPGTGFITPCAKSFWTTHSSNYWEGVTSGDVTTANDGTVLSPSAASSCVNSSGISLYSDAPDGSQVEKGSAAQILRQGNVAGADTGNRDVNRTMYTVVNSALAEFNVANTSLSEDLVNFIKGADVRNEKGGGLLTKTRPSIHGDVIHSRPLPVNYGGNVGVTVYYGANDGTLHAVNAETGVERWSLVAPEFYSKLNRLMTNSPLVNYPGLSASTTPTPVRKGYFFDGSTGLYQNADNSQVWIYPSMRRGGRMVYSLNVSTPSSPSFKWKIGCPNLENDTGCTTGMTGMGQSWSTPTVAFLKGNSTTVPVVIFGGGYDNCEDADSVSPSCGGTKGGFIYIVNADTGALLRSFATTRGVAADIALSDINGDGYPDYAYAADLGGNIYRVDFVASTGTASTGLPTADWTHRKVAFTDGDGRKFLFSPALFYTGGKVYVAIGSGDREHPLWTHYPYENVTNRFYVYKDDLALAADTAAVDLDVDLANYTTASTCSTTSVFPTSNLKGWYMSMSKGEQTVTSALIAAGMVTWSTNKPVIASASTCANTLGEAAGYWVNLFNASGAIGVDKTCGGDRRSVFVGGGLPPSPVFATSVPIDVNGKTIYVSPVIGAIKRKGGGGTGTGSTGGANSSVDAQEIRPAIKQKRKKTYQAVNSD